MTLTAATYLGHNTLAPLDRLVAAVRARGLDVEVVHRGPRTSADARRELPRIDVAWMCGGLFAQMRAAGDVIHEAVAAPIFAGESAAVYRSVIVTRRDGPSSVDDALSGTVAINEPESWSGCRALRRHVAPRWFADEVTTGSHIASLRAVRERSAGCAAVDHSIWAAVAADGRTALRVIDRTQDWPAPPVVVRPGLAPIARAVIDDVLARLRPVENVTAFVPVASSSYDAMR